MQDDKRDLFRERLNRMWIKLGKIKKYNEEVNPSLNLHLLHVHAKIEINWGKVYLLQGTWVYRDTGSPWKGHRKNTLYFAGATRREDI